MPKSPGPRHGLVVGLVEPTTLLGRDVRAVLKERVFPLAKLLLFHSTPGEDGLLTEADDEVAFVAPLLCDSLEACRIAFLCGSANDTRRFLGGRTNDGCLAIDLSGLRDGGPLVSLREAPPHAPLPPGGLLLTPDPTAYVLAEAVGALDALAPVSSAQAAVDRPASELGRLALDELFQQAIALASFRSVPKKVFGTQSAFNFFYPADTSAFEVRVTEDFARLLARPVPLRVFSARAGVFHGHHLRLEVRFEGAAPREETIRRALFRPGSAFEEVDPENLSGPVESAARDETLVLRVESEGSWARLALASDHLRRGGALLGVRIAEQAVRERALLADA